MIMKERAGRPRSQPNKPGYHPLQGLLDTCFALSP